MASLTWWWIHSQSTASLIFNYLFLFTCFNKKNLVEFAEQTLLNLLARLRSCIQFQVRRTERERKQGLSIRFGEIIYLRNTRISDMIRVGTTKNEPKPKLVELANRTMRIWNGKQFPFTYCCFDKLDHSLTHSLTHSLRVWYSNFGAVGSFTCRCLLRQNAGRPEM